MRVSKVSVGKGEDKKMVQMQRDTTRGSLVFYEDAGKADKTKVILPKEKKENFELSILNQTLIKREAIREKDRTLKTVKLGQWDILESLLTGKKFPYKISPSFKNEPDENMKKRLNDILINFSLDDINALLNYKFKNKNTKYTDSSQQEQKFILSDILLDTIKNRDINYLQPYFDWKEWYIATKSKYLIKSIENNRIAADAPASKRKTVLTEWQADFIKSGTIDLTDLHGKFQTNELMKALLLVPTTYWDEKKNKEERKKPSSYHADLKRALQQHQKDKLFGTNVAEHEANRNDKHLYVYNCEVVKYLEHYFPIKSSKRVNSDADREYYLKSDTIQHTIEKQLVNAVRMHTLQQGKFGHHQLEKSVNSDKLSDIKADEGLAFQLIDACAFAANNIRNVMDKEQEKDIIGKPDFKNSLQKQTVDEKLFRFFFNFDEAIRRVDEQLLWAMRGAVQQIRNSVLHYKSDALGKIFAVTNFQNGDTNEPYSNTIFKTILKNELKTVGTSIALQLMTGNVLEYYPKQTLIHFFENHPFSLYRSVVAFTPGYKNVMKQGINYQNAKRDERFYDMKLTAFLPPEDFPLSENVVDKERWEARYFLIKLIYNNLFLPAFTSENNAFFRGAVSEVLAINKTENEKQKHKYNQAFAEVRKMRNNETIDHYMAYVQSAMRVEGTKKEDRREEANKKTKDQKLNFERFLLQVFIKGFDTFLCAGAFQFIQSPESQLQSPVESDKAGEREKLREEIQKYIKPVESDINATNDTHIAFFVFCKLLDATHLSTLRNELTKYHKAGNNDTFIQFISIIELCLFSADTVPASFDLLYDSNKQYLENLKPYLKEGSDIRQWGDFYLQTDGKTPIINRSVEISRKYGTAGLLQQIVATNDKYKAGNQTWKNWKEGKDNIEMFIGFREQLREKWLEAKAVDEKSKSRNKGLSAEQDFVNNKSKTYIDCCNAIDRFNWLDNQLHLVHLNRLHLLTIDILGRMAGFTAIFERDFQYLCNNKSINTNEITVDFSSGLPYFDPKNADYTAIKTKLDKVFLIDRFRTIRNYIAHFNYLTNTANGQAPKFSLIDLINELRDLLWYDRKLRNIVPKAFIDMFDKHGMVLKFELNEQHRLKVASVTPKQLVHLGGMKVGEKGKEKQLTTNQVHPTFCAMCETLLELETKK